MANQFFTMADVYFHSGYYPSIFDKNAEEEKDIICRQKPRKKETEEEEKIQDFLGKPKDWIDAFGRHFRMVTHTRTCENGHEREILFVAAAGDNTEDWIRKRWRLIPLALFSCGST